jgi:hypothetical protein
VLVFCCRIADPVSCKSCLTPEVHESNDDHLDQVVEAPYESRDHQGEGRFVDQAWAVVHQEVLADEVGIRLGHHLEGTGGRHPGSHQAAEMACLWADSVVLGHLEEKEERACLVQEEEYHQERLVLAACQRVVEASLEDLESRQSPTQVHH